MAGGLMQLVAYGAQDVYLTTNPKVTFFQAVYKKYTNFAMEMIEQTVNGAANNSGRLSVTVARNGDLVGDMFMELEVKSTLTDLDALAWVAERAVSSVELTIGGQRMDKHYQKWWRLYSELYLDEAKKAQWGKMTSTANATATQARKVFLPLVFFFNRNPGLYLPLIALQYHEVRLDFDLAGNYESFFTRVPKIWAQYVYLDTEERRRFAQKGHEYLIEQVQHTGVDTVDADAALDKTKQLRLSYNHPVKELVWCFTDGTSDNTMWNFCGPNASNVVCTTGSNVALMRPELVGAPHLDIDSTDATKRAWVEEGDFADLAGVGPLVGPLRSFKVMLNGQDRFKAQSGKYFNQVQTAMHHSGCPYPGVYCYSFALKPEEHQPTGTCNFSRIDNAQVEVVTKKAVGTSSTCNMHMFAVNYNVLRIQSGMGGLAFSN